LQVKHREW